MKLSLYQKVLLTMVGLGLLVLGGVLFFSYHQTRSIANAEINRRLFQAQQAFANYDQKTREMLAAVNAYISGNSYFVAYMAEAIDSGDQESLLDQFEEIRNFSDCDFMIVLDAYGLPVVQTTAVLTDTERQMLERIVESDDGSRLLVGYLPLSGRLYNVALSPVVSGEYLNGYVLVGYQMDDQTAQEIGDITNCNTLFFAETSAGKSLAAGYFEDETIDAEDLGNQMPADLDESAESPPFTLNLNGGAALGKSGELRAPNGEMVGHYVTLKSIRKEMTPFRRLLQGTLGIGGLAILLMIPLSIAATRRVVNPVNHLVKAIGEVREGHYNEDRIQIQSQDEIGVMADAFKNMVRELREQRELIRFLERSVQQVENETFNSETLALNATGPITPSRIGPALRSAMKKGGALPAGFVLGDRYEILKVVGRGGMGVVYKARDRTLDEVVAIKMLHVDDLVQADILKKETKLARKVTHRNIVRIFDLGELEGIQFLSMEFVQGTTLKRVMRKVSRIPLSIGLRVVRSMCQGLAAAHEQGIIHGDIKPENVIINNSGEVKIMDFGVARVAKGEVREEKTVTGTPAYMPPEQFEGEPLTHRADIYSLGVMMYEMFTGKLPFVADNVVEIYKKHKLERPMPMHHLNPRVSKELDKVVVTAMSKEPDGRFESTLELLTILRKLS